MSQQQRRPKADKTRSSRQGKQIQKEVRSGRVRKSRSRDSLTIIPTPHVSRASGSTEGGGTDLVQASSRLEVPEPVLVDSGRRSADDITDDSQDGDYEDYDGQSEDTEVDEVEEEYEYEEEELEHGEENENASSGWGAQRPIEYGFPETQPTILTVTPGRTQSSGRGIDYPRRRAPVPVHVSQNPITPAILSRPPTTLGPLETPAITPSHSGPTTPELDNAGEQHSRSRRNMATGLERSIVLKARDLMWDWTIFVNPFPDAITMNEAVRRCWKDACRELGFPNFPDATPASNDQVSYP